MARVYWKKYRSVAIVASFVILYLIARAQKYEQKAFVFIPSVHPSEPWEFVADFSNMKYLNPTIMDFNLLEESGDYGHWKYSVEYSERLSHWPHSFNTAIAHFNIKGSPKKTHISYIPHTGLAYYLAYIAVLDSVSEFKFSHGNSSRGAACEENIQYQCPAILSSFCRREVVFQRNAIMNNLFKKFSGKKF